jgi:hypothetical protein
LESFYENENSYKNKQGGFLLKINYKKVIKINQEERKHSLGK